MMPEIEQGNKAIEKKYFPEALELFEQALQNVETSTEARICRNRIRELKQTIKQLGAVARMDVVCAPAGQGSCRIKVTSPQNAILGMVEKVFTLTNQKTIGEETEIARTGNSVTTTWTGLPQGIRCTGCKRFRGMVKDNLGKNGYMLCGRCCFEDDL